MKKTVLITGGGHAELPLIDALHRLGCRVVSTGMNTDGLGHQKADLYIPADFSDREAVLSIAREQKVCGIVSGCNDFAYLSAAYACEQLGLPGHDAPEIAETVHHKDRFRDVLRENGLPYPAFRLCTSRDELDAAMCALRLPVVVKPTDLTGGKGVAICESREQVMQRAEDALAVTRRGAVLLEEYVQGSNHGTSVLLQGGKVRFAFFDNEEYYRNPYLVSGAYSPSDLSEAVKADIVRQIETVATALSLRDGLFHCQCIVTGDGLPYLIDPCRRAPGELYVQLVSLASGIDYPMAIVKSELGLDLEETLRFQPCARNISRECIMTDRNGVIRGFPMSPEYRAHEIDRLQWGQIGDRVEDYRKYKAGIVFFEYADPAELKARMRSLYDNMRIDVQAEEAGEDPAKLTIHTEDCRAAQLEEIRQLLAMRKRLLIWGKGEFSGIVLDYLRENGIQSPAAFLVDDAFARESDRDTVRLSDVLCGGAQNDVIVFGFYNYPAIAQKRAAFCQLPYLYDFHFAVVQGKRLKWDAQEAKSREAEYRATFALLEDERSRQTMQRYLNAATAGRFRELFEDCYISPQYFNSITERLHIDTFIDCGAYDGDSIHDFVQAFPDYQRILAFEPDPDNVERIRAREAAEHLRNLTLVNKGVYSENTTLFFQANGASNSSISDSGDVAVEVTCLDDYIGQISGNTLLKMDIEGSELSALKGAERLIREKHPALAVCVYHKERDLIDIPQYIHALAGEGVYRYYLGYHGLDLAELCFYAIPNTCETEERS